MMKIRYKTSFHQYSDKAIELAKETSIGKEIKDSEGEVIGTIVEVGSVEGDSKMLEFIVELKGANHLNVLN